MYQSHISFSVHLRLIFISFLSYRNPDFNPGFLSTFAINGDPVFFSVKDTDPVIYIFQAISAGLLADCPPEVQRPSAPFR